MSFERQTTGDVFFLLGFLNRETQQQILFPCVRLYKFYTTGIPQKQNFMN